MEQSKRIKQPMQKRQIIRDLKEKGFRQVKPFPNLFITETGTVYSLNTGKELKINHRNTVCISGGKRVSVPKLVLFVFRNEPIREKSHIRYLDGNTGNLNPSNIEYVRIYESDRKSKINAENLYTAIRCYFEVPKHYKIKDCILTRIYLTEIIRKRHFYEDNYKRFGLDIFQSYMEGIVNNMQNVGKKHNTNFRDVQIIVNDFLNLLINDILADLKAGQLKVNNFQPRPKTKTQLLRETNEKLKEVGLKPLPLRKKSAKKLLKDFRKKLNEPTNEQKQ